MADKKSQGTHLVAAFAGFGLTGLTAWLLLVTALVVWLADVLNSLIWSSLIVGGFFIAVAVAIYVLAIRTGLAHLRERIDTVYEVARLARAGYDWVRTKFSIFMPRHRK